MSIVVITTALNNLHAQEIITVSGKILNQPEAKSKPEPFIEMDMHVFAFNSIIEAKKAIVSLNNGENNIIFKLSSEDKAKEKMYEDIFYGIKTED